MSRSIDADYEQAFLLPPSLEEWITADHPARFIRDFVDALHLESLGFVSSLGDEGRPHYAPSLLLKVWLWGYFEGTRSSRRLEKACRNQMPLIWLTGMKYPDHNTIWRFWNGHHQEIRKLFKQTVQVAASSGALGLVVQAVDGTKIQAWVSKQSAWHKDDLERLLRELDTHIAAIEEEIERSGTQEGPTYALPPALHEAKTRKQAIEQALAEIDVSGQKQLHPHDKDARMMKLNEGTRFAYNAQAIADDKHQILVAEDVSQSRNDHEVLVPMLEQAMENVGTGPRVTLADGGYNAGESLHRAQQAEMSVLVNSRDRNPGPYHVSRFHYDSVRDCFTCPQGKELHHSGGGYNKSHGCVVEQYRCPHTKQCPVRAQCTKNPRARIIERSPWHAAVEAHRARAQTEEARALLSRRKVIIEPVFAMIKEHSGFRRWSHRGLENVRTQWSMICTAHNLRKLYELWRRNPGPTAASRKKLHEYCFSTQLHQNLESQTGLNTSWLGAF